VASPASRGNKSETINQEALNQSSDFASAAAHAKVFVRASYHTVSDLVAGTRFYAPRRAVSAWGFSCCKDVGVRPFGLLISLHPSEIEPALNGVSTLTRIWMYGGDHLRAKSVIPGSSAASLLWAKCFTGRVGGLQRSLTDLQKGPRP
jgi:hypothetical protein